MSSMFSAVSSRPVIASTSAGSTALRSGCSELVLGHARCSPRTEMLADLVASTDEVLLGALEREGGERGLAQPVVVAEGGDADDRHLDGLGGLDGRRVADARSPSSAAPRLITTSSAARGARPSANSVRVELAILDPVPGERRRPVAAELVAVLADELAEALDGRARRRRRRRPSRTSSTSDAWMSPRWLSGSPGSVASSRGVAYHHVGARVGLGEEVVEVRRAACRRARASRTGTPRRGTPRGTCRPAGACAPTSPLRRDGSPSLSLPTASCGR